MKTILGRLAGALVRGTDVRPCRSANQDHHRGRGGACLCYLPTVLAKQLGEYDKAGLAVELIDLKGGSDALKAVLGGSADVVSGYFDHCVNLAAKKQELTSFVVYDRYPGLVLVVSPLPITPRSKRSRIWLARKSASARRAPRPISFSNIC